MDYDHFDIKEAIEEQIDFTNEKMPETIKKAILNLNSDLKHGPLYFDDGGESCSCFDEGAKAFNFGNAVDIVKEYIDENINDIEMESSFDPKTEESIFESIDGTRKQILKGILGKELYNQIY